MSQQQPDLPKRGRGRPSIGSPLTPAERQRQRRTRQEAAGQIEVREWVPADRAEEARRLLTLLREGSPLPHAEKLAELSRELAAARDRAEAAEACVLAVKVQPDIAAPLAGAIMPPEPTGPERKGSLLGRLFGRGGSSQE